ncbi:MAG: DUF2087 domain-containing protein [Pseudomonadota bacterium]
MSKFAEALRTAWPDARPTHLSAMNLVARAAGYRSWNVLKASAPPPSAIAEEEARRINLALRVFDATGRMTRWPKGYLVQGLCLVAFWSRIPSHRDLTERQINAILKDGEVFGDHVLLRRSLIDHGLMRRSNDGSVYRRVERKPSTAERFMIRALSERWSAHATRDWEVKA